MASLARVSRSLELKYMIKIQISKIFNTAKSISLRTSFAQVKPFFGDCNNHQILAIFYLFQIMKAASEVNKIQCSLSYNYLISFQMTSQPLKQELLKNFASRPDAESSILSEVRGSRFHITFNRPKRYNAFSNHMYIAFTKLIKQANQNSSIKYIIISGSGANYSSGNDLNNFIDYGNPKGTLQQVSKIIAGIIYDLNEAIILSEKPLFAITEGKVIGFAFTQLALYDRVFSVVSSQFNAPLVKIAQGPEMSSAFTFPKIFGAKTAEDLIVKGIKVDSTFLEKYDFVTSCKTRAEAEELLQRHLQELDSLDWVSYVKTRQLFKDIDREILLKTNRRETDNLAERWTNPDLPRLIAEYMSKVKGKAKL